MLQLGIQVPQLLRSGWRISIQNRIFPTRAFDRFAKLMVPVIFGIGIVQIMCWSHGSFASYLQEGSVTAIYMRTV